MIKMNKIIICDKNKELIEKIKLIKFTNRYHEIVISDKDDVLECKNDYPNAKIVTASNPEFNPGGGLDKILFDKYKDEWGEAREFNWTDNLFFVVSCDKNIKATREIIQRAFVGVSGYSHKFDMILTGIGTSIAGLDIDTFIELLIEFDKRIFNGAELNNAILNDAELNHAELNYVKLNNAKLNDAKLNHAELNCAVLNNAKLNGAVLNDAELNNVKLNGAELNHAELNHAELNDAELNDVSGILEFSPSDWLNNNFKKTEKGYIVYKAICNTTYEFKYTWKEEENAILTEVCNRNVTNTYGCGVNFGTKDYCLANYPKSILWECLIPFEKLADVIVPIHTDGEARTSWLQLIKKVK